MGGEQTVECGNMPVRRVVPIFPEVVAHIHPGIVAGKYLEHQRGLADGLALFSRQRGRLTRLLRRCCVHSQSERQLI